MPLGIWSGNCGDDSCGDWKYYTISGTVGILGIVRLDSGGSILGVSHRHMFPLDKRTTSDINGKIVNGYKQTG